MIAATLSTVWRFLNPAWLTGPIFEKELRVSSRRKRNYLLRFAYLVLMTVFVTMVWWASTKSFGHQSAAFRVSRMAMAGKSVVATIIWFQFCTLQLIAAVSMSTAISDEIYHKTLGVLMTTPITSFQIVMGKLFSKLWQMIILLAISIPLMAIVRVFGGVPWDFVIAGVCITLTAMIFVGSVSMLFSIRSRRSYAVVLKTIFFVAVVYAFLPGIISVIFRNHFDNEIFQFILLHFNPSIMLRNITMMLFMAGPIGSGSSFFSWPIHCGIMLGCSAVFLGWSVKSVRKVALRQATGEAGMFVKRRARRAQKKAQANTPLPEQTSGRIRRVVGSAIIWKELREPMVQGGKAQTMIGAIAAVVALAITYFVCIKENCLSDSTTHMLYTIIFVLIGMLMTAVLSATTITSEKESRSWPILLATPLSDWHIVLGKAVGILRKCLPIWIFLTFHLDLFVSVGYIHPIALLHMAMLIAWMVVFFTGSGLYFSARFKRTTTAVVANVGLALVLWLIIPIIIVLASEIGAFSETMEELAEASKSINPLLQASTIMEGAGGVRNAQLTTVQLDYDWPGWSNDYGVKGTTRIMLRFMGVYMTAGVVFMWLAKRRLRRSIF